jgi:hypothetical protein
VFAQPRQTKRTPRTTYKSAPYPNNLICPFRVAHFRVLHSWQASCTLAHVCGPPSETGMMWSMLAIVANQPPDLPGILVLRPHIIHLRPSLSYSSRKVISSPLPIAPRLFASCLRFARRFLHLAHNPFSTTEKPLLNTSTRLHTRHTLTPAYLIPYFLLYHVAAKSAFLFRLHSADSHTT